MLDYKTPLAKAKTLPRKELIEVENDEAQSRLKMKLAKDKLLVYGLTDKEIENAKNEDGVQKAKMILRSRADGVVVKRDVVQGNYYDSADLLMTIAPLDHLWVRGSVSELDAEKVEVGQNLEGHLPVLGLRPRRSRARSSTSTRRSIPNRGRRSSGPRSPTPRAGSRPGCSCGCWWRSRPRPGRTVIPRAAMVSVDRIRLRLRQEAGEDGHVRAAADLRGEGKQRHRHRRRARRRPPRADRPARKS